MTQEKDNLEDDNLPLIEVEQLKKLGEIWNKYSIQLDQAIKEVFSGLSKFLQSEEGIKFATAFTRLRAELSEEEQEKVFDLVPKDIMANVDSIIKYMGVSRMDLLTDDQWKEIARKLVGETYNPTSNIMEFGQTPLSKLILPATAYILATKPASSIGRGMDGQGEFDFIVSKDEGKLEPVTVFVNISFDDEDVRYSRNLTTWDRSVHNAVCTLWKAGNSIFTAEEVYRTMNGFTESEFVKPNTLGAVTKSINKLSETNIWIDYTDHMLMNNKSLNLKNDERIDLKGKILELREVILRKTGGKGGIIKRGYKLIAEDGPILLKYSEDVKQVITVPYQMLNTKDATRSTQEVIILREYLLTRISRMKNPKTKSSNRILYSRVFSELGIAETDQTPHKLKKIREHIKSILELWRKRDKFIKGFEEYKDGNTYTGIKIFY